MLPMRRSIFFHYSNVFINRKSLSITRPKLTRPMSASVRPKVYVTRKVPIAAIKILWEKCEVSQWDSDEPVPRDELLRNIVGVDALYCLLTDRIDRDILEKAGPSLKVIGTMSVGYDHLDLGECHRRGITVGYTPDVLTDATAELTVSLLLTVSRNIAKGIRAVKSGEWSSWKPVWMCGPGLTDSTVGIVGMGRIGLGVARRLKPFGPTCILYSGNSVKQDAMDIGAEFVPFDDLIRRSDFVIATCPLTPQTNELFNKSVFSHMKSSAVFVNTSRGAVVNQDDLYDTLRNGVIFGAGLDVTTPEPLPTDHPLLTLDNCVILPHIGSATDHTRTLMAKITAQNIVAALDGQPMISQLKTD